VGIIDVVPLPSQGVATLVRILLFFSTKVYSFTTHTTHDVTFTMTLLYEEFLISFWYTWDSSLHYDYFTTLWLLHYPEIIDFLHFPHWPDPLQMIWWSLPQKSLKWWSPPPKGHFTPQNGYFYVWLVIKRINCTVCARNDKTHTFFRKDHYPNRLFRGKHSFTPFRQHFIIKTLILNFWSLFLIFTILQEMHKFLPFIKHVFYSIYGNTVFPLPNVLFNF
jgi:hypothetical protein